MVFHEYSSYEMYFFFVDMSVLMAVDLDVFCRSYLLPNRPFFLAAPLWRFSTCGLFPAEATKPWWLFLGLMLFFF